MIKSYLFIILAIAGLLVSCADDSGSSTVKLVMDQTMLDSDGNSIFDGNSELYVAVYDTVAIESRLIKTESFPGTTTILAIKVDPGFNRVFVMALANSEGDVTYSGTVTYEVVITPVVYIPITLTQVSLLLQKTTETLPTYLEWNLIDGASKYEILRSSTSGGPYEIYKDTFVYFDSFEPDGNYYTVQAYFAAFNLYTAMSNEVQFEYTVPY